MYNKIFVVIIQDDVFLLYETMYNKIFVVIIQDDVFLLYKTMYFYYTRRCISIIQDDV